MVRTIADRLEHPLAREVIECGLIDPWKHSFPVSRENCITFAHTSFVKVPGIATVEMVDDVLSMTHQIDTTEAEIEGFGGLWTLYEKPPVMTGGFDRYKISDDNPSQMDLFMGDVEVQNPACSYGMLLASGLALDHLVGRLNSKIDEQLKLNV